MACHWEWTCTFRCCNLDTPTGSFSGSFRRGQPQNIRRCSSYSPRSSRTFRIRHLAAWSRRKSRPSCPRSIQPMSRPCRGQGYSYRLDIPFPVSMFRSCRHRCRFRTPFPSSWASSRFLLSLSKPGQRCSNRRSRMCCCTGIGHWSRICLVHTAEVRHRVSDTRFRRWCMRSRLNQCRRRSSPACRDCRTCTQKNRNSADQSGRLRSQDRTACLRRGLLCNPRWTGPRKCRRPAHSGIGCSGSTSLRKSSGRRRRICPIPIATFHHRVCHQDSRKSSRESRRRMPF